LVPARAYPLGSMTRAGQTYFLFFGFARIFAR
jgi:hypothetical protein